MMKFHFFFYFLPTFEIHADMVVVDDTRELIETAKRVQRERREKSVSSQQQNTVTTVTNNAGEVTTTTKTTTTASVTENNTKTTTTVAAVVAQKPPDTALSHKSQRTKELLNKIKTQVSRVDLILFILTKLIEGSSFRY